jgi:hypothetical protein
LSNLTCLFTRCVVSVVIVKAYGTLPTWRFLEPEIHFKLLEIICYCLSTGELSALMWCPSQELWDSEEFSRQWGSCYSRRLGYDDLPESRAPSWPKKASKWKR